MADPVGSGRVSKVVGYLLSKGDFRESSPNLPQRIAILGEANTANQGALDLTPKEITSEQQAGNLYGFGSPIHRMLSILKPSNGDGVGGIPIIVYPQIEAVGGAAKVFEIEPSGVATKNGTHYLVIAGRDNIKGQFYAINVLEGDTASDITAKIEDAVNNVLGCPFTAQSDDYTADLTSKWKGLTANGLTLSVDTGDDDLGLTYVINSTAAGSGTPDIADALEAFGNAWNTIVINSYGTVDAVMDALEAFNGIADPENPTGRYGGIVFKPFIALTGSVADDASAITDARKLEMTIAICPAPLSQGLPMEAAANMAFLFALQAQDSPHLDVSGKFYPDMPTPEDIGLMADYDNRDAFVKDGLSTVDLVAGKYKVMDFVTTYHPDGEEPPQFRYCRNLNLDWNVRYGYFLLEEINLVDHAIARDNDVVSASKVVKPKMWKGVLKKYADDLSERALIVDADFMKDATTVTINGSNPDRLDTFFRYKRSGFARISSTEAQAGFNFGTLNV